MRAPGRDRARGRSRPKSAASPEQETPRGSGELPSAAANVIALAKQDRGVRAWATISIDARCSARARRLRRRGSALAQTATPPTPRQKGPRVWLDLDQQELDDAYDQSKYAANLAADRQALRDQQRAGARAARRAEAARLRVNADRGARPLSGAQAERAGACVHPWRRVAQRARAGLGLSGRDLRACGRALHRGRLQQRGRDQGRPDADGGPGAPRRRLGLPERRELRRRSEPHLPVRALVRRASRRCRARRPTGRRISACRRTC